MYVYLCVCVPVYACHVCLCVCACAHACTRLCMHAMCVCVCACVHLCMHAMYVCVDVVCAPVYVSACHYVRECVCMCVCSHVCVSLSLSLSRSLTLCFCTVQSEKSLLCYETPKTHAPLLPTSLARRGRPIKVKATYRCQETQLAHSGRG